MQAHYLSTRIQNEFIDICGSHVQTAILHEIVKAKYFLVIVDATPDFSYKEQTTLVIRYVKILDNSNFSVEERFILFDNFSKKTGREIAARTLEILKTLKLDFEACIGQAYDNCANMAGNCGNYSLNLVGVDCAESCKEAVTYFGTIQQIYNLFSSSPQRWEILKQHFPVSLHGMSKTRWSARIDGVKPVAQHLNSVRSALNELGVPHLTAQAKMELNAIQKYISKFDCILMSSIWMKLLTMIHQSNLIIEARQVTLDIEKDNIENLCNDIQRLREQFDKILNESKFVARNIDVSCEFLTNRHFPSQDDAELYFKINVYFVIIDSIQSGLTRQFQSLQKICKLFGFLLQFKNLNDEDLVLAAQHFQHKYDKDISQELENEALFL
ncbi:zinc finger MYM-type protein 1-like [Hydra vulgaris]|uniref:Zinc finger MYM-type protein 1-like n=1 Tax=Hydra vulgaris TaxID=6087 RepID=A0ABM4CLS6_HYDVU